MTPVLAVSDLLVLTALERAWARTRRRPTGAQSNNPPAATRHAQYMSQPVPSQRLDVALRDAWALCPLLVDRHSLDVEPVAWMQLLDSYTRTLLMMGQPHRVAELGRHLQALPAHVPDGAWIEDDETG